MKIDEIQWFTKNTDKALQEIIHIDLSKAPAL